MYFVIVGAGVIGISLARWLVASGNEVAVIDKNEARCAFVDDELGSISVLGDGAEVAVLTRAGVGRADALIAATDEDDTNLVACQVANHLFKTPQTISIVNVPEHEKLFRLLGVNVLVNSTDLVVTKIQGEMSGLLSEEIEQEVSDLNDD